MTLIVNETAYTQQTNQSGHVSLHLALQPGDTSANMHQVMARFNGTSGKARLDGATQLHCTEKEDLGTCMHVLCVLSIVACDFLRVESFLYLLFSWQ